MNSSLTLEYTVPGDDFTRAGEASGSVKKTLKQLGFPADVIRKVAKQGDCIIVGWCGNHILQEEETIDVFLYASDLGFRIGRKVEFNGLDRKSAEKQMKILTGTGSVPGIPYGTCLGQQRRL